MKDSKSNSQNICPMVVGLPPCSTAEVKIKESIDILIIIYKLHGYEGTIDTTKTLSLWMKQLVLIKNDWMALLKYKLANFNAFHREQEVLPTCPYPALPDVPGQLLGGGLGRFVRVLKIRDRIKFYEFLSSVSQSKKGMPRADEEDVKRKVESTVTHLTSEDKSLPIFTTLPKGVAPEWKDVNPKIELTVTKQTIKEQLVRTVKELFNGHKYTNEDKMEPTFPSTSANYINNVKNAGAVGTILDHPDLLKGLRQLGGHTQIDEVINNNNNNTSEEEERENEERDENMNRQYIMNNDNLNLAFETLYYRMILQALNEEPNVKAVGLIEALKIRIITKGPPITYTVLKPLQRFMHRVLRNHKVFQLIGKPDDEEIILNAMGAQLGKDQKYISGDYKDATNQLKSWVSETIANAIADEAGLDKVERELFIISLTKHIFDGILQKTGQLMGSITSFPILCIANAAMTRWAMEIAENKKILLRDCALLINGDDVVFKSNIKAYKAWQIITKGVGLEESLGKTFVSSQFLEINSRTYLRTEPRKEVYINTQGKPVVRDQPFTKIKFVNMGLLTGQKRSGGKTSMKEEESEDPIGVRATELLNSCPESMTERVYTEFLQYHKEILDKMRLPYYIPRWLGGVGLPINDLHQPSDLDRRIVATILNNYGKTITNAETTIKCLPKPLNSKINWRTRIIAEQRMPEPYYTKVETEEVVARESALNKQCINILFDSSVRLSDLHDEEGARTSLSKIIEYNAKLYTPSLWTKLNIKLSPPISIKKLEKIKLFAATNIENISRRDLEKKENKKQKINEKAEREIVENMNYEPFRVMNTRNESVYTMTETFQFKNKKTNIYNTNTHTQGNTSTFQLVNIKHKHILNKTQSHTTMSIQKEQRKELAYSSTLGALD